MLPGLPPNVKLNARERAVYRLRFVAGLSQTAIAREFGITQQAVSRRELSIRDRFAAAGHPEPRVPGRYSMRLPPMRAVAC